MKRHTIPPRKNWEQKIREQGFLFYNVDSYYTETAVYEFTPQEIDIIEAATNSLFEMCMCVVDHVIEHKLWNEFFIPRKYAGIIEQSWKEKDTSFYGRFDLAYNNGTVKMLEFNADTPTSLLEAAVIQWYWLQDYDSKLDQFNSIHERLLNHLAVCKKNIQNNKLYFSCIKDNTEDLITVKYLQDVAAQAGLNTDFVFIEDIGINKYKRFTKSNGDLLQNIFKLYPYEWMFHETFGKYLYLNHSSCRWIEPPYKAILSNKMLLKYLYDLFPDSPYVLPCTYLKRGQTKSPYKDFVKKPVFSREGANVTIVKNGKVVDATGGEYGWEGFLCQEYAELPLFDNNRPVIGSWIIGGQAAGIGIRESAGYITGNTSRFCPHYFVNKA